MPEHEHDLEGLHWDYAGIVAMHEREERRRQMQAERAVLRDFGSRFQPLLTLIVVCYYLNAKLCFLADCHRMRLDGRIYCKGHARSNPQRSISDSVALAIVEEYESGTYMTSQVAAHFNVSTRMVQRLAKDAGVIRVASESMKLSRINGHWDYFRLPPEARKVRKQLGAKLRFKVLSAHPYCLLCGARASDITKLEVDHIDMDPSNNAIENLQVLCDRCDIGKGGRIVG